MSGGADESTGPNYGARHPVGPPEATRAEEFDSSLDAGDPTIDQNAERSLPEWSAVSTDTGTIPADVAAIRSGPPTGAGESASHSTANGTAPDDDWNSARALTQRPIAHFEPDPRPAPRQPITREPDQAPPPDADRRGVNPFLLIVGAIALMALGAGGYALLTRDSGTTEAAQTGTLSSSSSAAVVQNISLLLQGIGYGDITVEDQDGTIVVSGAVDTQADVAAVITATASLADGTPINTDNLSIAGDPAAPSTDDDGRVGEPGELVVADSGMADPLQRLQVILHRTVAAAPVIFEPGTGGLSSWHSNTLDQVSAILNQNPGIAVSVVGYTDRIGPAADNEALSLERAEAVKAYLVDKGIDPALLQTEARGESAATGIRDVSYLERRVEFEVVDASLTPARIRPLDVGIIVPSARDDLAFSQSLVDALDVMNQERGGLTISVTENVFDIEQASTQARQYVADGNDVVILHGAQFRPIAEELAAESPDVVFIVGPDPLTTDLPNVFVYTVAAEQGAYVLGDLAGGLSANKTIGIVGPIPAPEPVQFVEGFRQGAEGQGATVLVDYVGSFSDTDAAADVAQAHIAAGADVLTGTSQLVQGPVGVAEERGLLWFANQANQSSLAPDNVVASQVYHFEVAIREILAEIDANSTTGGTFPLTLGNGGMLLEFNPDYPLSRELRARADDLLLGVAAGSISVDVDVEG